MPFVIGAIDCTHIHVRPTDVPDKELFRNRKGKLSLNCQAVVDADLRFLNLVTRWPGSVHDSRIFRTSELYASFETNEIDYGILLGDNGYGLSRYLLTPVLNVTPHSAEARYNKSQIKTRNCIERAFGAWKRKFR